MNPTATAAEQLYAYLLARVTHSEPADPGGKDYGSERSLAVSFNRLQNSITDAVAGHPVFLRGEAIAGAINKADNRWFSTIPEQAKEPLIAATENLNAVLTDLDPAFPERTEAAFKSLNDHLYYIHTVQLHKEPE